jgi:ribosomal protein L37E
MAADRKIVICDRCGERYDYIPETCPKCGEILAARMDPDAWHKIEECLRRPDKIKRVLVVIYSILFCIFAPGVIYGILNPVAPLDVLTIILLISVPAPIVFALISSIFETSTNRSFYFHGLIMVFYICCILAGILGACFPYYIYFVIILMAFAVYYIEEKRKRLTFTWTNAIIIIVIWSLVLIANFWLANRHIPKQ